jgi:hypothetical protein
MVLVYFIYWLLIFCYRCYYRYMLHIHFVYFRTFYITNLYTLQSYLYKSNYFFELIVVYSPHFSPFIDIDSMDVEMIGVK